MAAANSYTPSASGLATGRAAAGLRSSILAYDDSAVAASVVDVAQTGVSSQMPRAAMKSFASPMASGPRPDANLVDVAVANSGRKSAATAEDSLHASDARDEYDVAWDQFGVEWDLQPAFAGV